MPLDRWYQSLARLALAPSLPIPLRFIVTSIIAWFLVVVLWWWLVVLWVVTCDVRS